MNKGFFAYYIKLLLAAYLAVPFMAAVGFGASVQWTQLADRERVTINLDNGEGSFQSISRVGEQDLSVSMLRPGAAAAPAAQKTAAPAGAKLYGGWDYGPDGAFLRTQTPSFGYIVSRPNATRMVVDIFNDPLGARWKKSPDSATPQATPQQSPLQAPQTPAPAQQPQVQQSPAHAAPPAPRNPATAAAPPQRAAPQASGVPNTTFPDLTPDRPSQRQPQAPESPETTFLSSRAQSDDSGARPPAPPASSAPATPQQPARQPVQQPPAQLPVGAQAPQTTAQPPQTAAQPPAATPARTQTPPQPQTPQVAPGRPVQTQTAQPVQTAPGTGPANIPPRPEVQSTPLKATDPAGHTIMTTPAPATSDGAQANATQSATQTPAQPTSQQAQPYSGPRPAPGMGYVFRSRLNPGGPEDWVPPPGTEATGQAAPAGSNQTAGAEARIPIATGNATAGATPVQVQSGNATSPKPAPQGNSSLKAPAPAGHNSTAQVTPVEVYKDEKGNIVPPPPDPAEVLKEVEEDVKDAKYADALAKLEPLLKNPKLNREQREQVLHRRADVIFALHKDNPAATFSEIDMATKDAMNYNLKSPRNAAALLRLGYINLKVDNTYEAAAYFNVLRREYPNDQSVPLSYYYWGDYQFEHKNWQEAVDQFQYITQNYPDSAYTREASLGLARAYYQMGYYDLAYKIVDFIEKRWPRYYLDYPPILSIMGDVAFRLNELDRAAQFYWTYYNLEPNGPSADIILARLGDIYSMQKQKKAAQEVYGEALRRFPDKDGGLVSLMRMAEDGLYDSPEITQMYSVFERPYNPKPMEAYRKIINEHPNSALVPLARLKLAMWNLFYKDYIGALDQCSAIVKANSKSDLAAKARDVALKTFAVMSAESVNEKRYARMREIWERYPILNEQQEAMTPESRVALAVSYRDEGNPDKALSVLEPFFLGAKMPQYSEMALSLALTIHLESDNWKALEDLSARVNLWQLTPETQRQLNYALALTYENQDRMTDATPIWQKLYDQGNLPPTQQAYAEYFLARSAEQRRDLENAYNMGQDALSRLLQLAKEDPSKADTEKIKNQIGSLMSIAETAGHMAEAMGYADQYITYIEKDSPDYQGVLYRIAKINLKRGNRDAWQKGLENLSTNYPNSVYGRTAASELRSSQLSQDAAKFSPTGRL